MLHIKITIQYDGTRYSGWQRQKKGGDIQTVIENVISKIFKKDIKIRGAGRTDAGVHALGQVASFKADLKMPLSVLKKALNSLLPEDIRITSLDEVDDIFHPQYSAKRKSYIYYICIDEECSCFIRRYVWHYPRQLNLSMMKHCLSLFKGTIDFTAFSGSTDVKSKVRTVHDFTMQSLSELSFLDMKIQGNFIKFRIEADGFLKYMARNIVGCMIEIGRGRLTYEQIKKAIQKGERPKPLQTAPACGLFLEKIFY